ncbi:MAG: hypothetical protein F9K32_14540 [Desulfobulbaceae bacterium]|nr:MAG: hypothetical protein F9K32_14540 [Desulfobulbaceae bacterium]
MKKTISTLALAGTIFISTFAMAADLIQKDGNGRFQAELQNVPLSDVAKFMQTTHGVKFKGDPELLQNPVTVTFKGLDMEAMLKKILARNNYVFAYDSNGNVIEVKLMLSNSSGTNPSMSKNASLNRVQNQEEKDLTRNTLSDPTVNEEDVQDDITSFEPQEMVADGEDEKTQDDITLFKPVKIESKTENEKVVDDITSFEVNPK